MKTAHLADDEKPLATLCGLAWEDWQEPDMPTDEEIGFAELSYGAKVAVRELDQGREPKPGESIRQCQACFKAAIKAA